MKSTSQFPAWQPSDSAVIWIGRNGEVWEFSKNGAVCLTEYPLEEKDIPEAPE